MNEADLPNAFLPLSYKFRSISLRAFRQQGLDIVPMHIKSLHIIDAIDQCKANDLAERLDRDKGQVARLIKEMEGKKYIERLANPEDKRSQFIAMTDTGKDILQQMLAIEANIIQAMQADISEQELQVFIRVSLKMLENLKR